MQEKMGIHPSSANSYQVVRVRLSSTALIVQLCVFCDTGQRRKLLLAQAQALPFGAKTIFKIRHMTTFLFDMWTFVHYSYAIL